MDITAPAHPLVFRPIIERLRRRGHEVIVTARDYAQTLELLELHGIEYVSFGRHGGASRARKLASLMRRTLRIRRVGATGFDLAAAHGSNELALAARWLGIPAVNMFDYEWATQQHKIGCRLARRVITPEAIPPERLRRYGVGPEKLVQYAGRILRPYDGKTTAEVHDYVDERTRVLASSLAKRAPGYVSLGFPDPRRLPYTPSSANALSTGSTASARSVTAVTSSTGDSWRVRNRRSASAADR